MPAPASAQPADELHQASKPNQQNHRLALNKISFTDEWQGGRNERSMGVEGKAGAGAGGSAAVTA